MSRWALFALFANVACLPALETKRCSNDDQCGGLICVLGECQTPPLVRDAQTADVPPGPPIDAGFRDADSPDNGDDRDAGPIDSGVMPDGGPPRDAAEPADAANQWVLQASEVASPRVEPRVVTTGADGRVTIAIEFDQDLSFDGSTFSHEGVDTLIAQISDTGTVLWTAHFGGSDAQRITSLAIAANGDVIAGGSLLGDSNVDGSGVGDFSSLTAVFLRLDRLGALVRYQTFGGSGADEISSIVLDPSGSLFVYAGGLVESDYTVGACDFAVPNAPTPDTVDAFVAAFDVNTFECIWVNAFGSNRNDWVQSIAYDSSSQRIVAVGLLGDDVLLRDVSGARSFNIRNRAGNQSEESFIASFAAVGGAVLSGADVGGMGTQRLVAVAVNAAGRVFTTGSFIDSPTIVINGTISLNLGSPSRTVGLSLPIAFDSATAMTIPTVTGPPSAVEFQSLVLVRDQVALWGDIDSNSTLSFNNNFVDANSDDALLIYFDQSGGAQRAVAFSSTDDDGGYALAYDPSGYLLLTGSFAEELTFPGGLTVTPRSSSNRDGFVFRYAP